MGSKEVFYEILTSVSSTPINEEDFEVSAPIVIDVAKTMVNVKPKGQTAYYGAARLTYTRLDLNEIETVELTSQGETTYHQITQRLVDRRLFRYRIYTEYNRFLYLTRNDIVDGTIQFNVPNEPNVLELTAEPSSYLFVGKLRVRLLT